MINFRLLIKWSTKIKRLKRYEWNLMSQGKTQGRECEGVSSFSLLQMSEPETMWQIWNSLQVSEEKKKKKVPGGCKLALRKGGKETIGLYLQGCMSSLQNSLLSRLRSSRRFLPLFSPPHLSLEGSGERANKMMTARDREGESEGRNWDFEGLWERFCTHPCWFFSPLSLQVRCW